MPKLCRARPPADAAEERRGRRLARSRLGPRACILRARMIAMRWDGQRAPDIAVALACHPQTGRERLARFNAEGFAGLRDRPRPGRRRRIAEAERSRVIRVVAGAPPGRLGRHGASGLAAADETREAHWTLDALAAAAQRTGIAIKRSQIRRLLRAEGVRWRQPRSWATRVDPEFAPQGPRS